MERLTAPLCEAVRTSIERARLVGEQTVTSWRLALNGQSYVEHLLEENQALDLRNQVIMTDLALIELKQFMNLSPEGVDPRDRAGSYIPVYVEAARYYEAQQQQAQYEHVKYRLNECLSYIMSPQIYGIETELQDTYIVAFCSRIGLDAEQTAYMRQRLSWDLITRLQFKRLQPRSRQRVE